MKNVLFLLLSLFFSLIAFGQEPIAEFSLDCTLTENSGFYNDINSPFFPACECGVNNEAITLTDNVDLTLDTTISEIFDGDFAFSFYFKSETGLNVQELLSVGDNCSSDSTLRVYYLESSAEVIVDMSQSVQKSISFRAEVDVNKCWNHVVISKSANDFFIYINGSLKTEFNSANDIRIGVQNPIQLGFGPCVGVISNEFLGQLDELKIFDEHIQEFRARQLYIRNNEITSQDTTLFMNDFVNVSSLGLCNSDVVWSPGVGIDNVTSFDIEIEGIETTDYVATFIDETQCVSTDTFKLIVIDPDDVKCEDLILPNVFTPNGDGLNETFHILNGFIVEELISFQVFDRWGEVVFDTKNKEDEWDGNFKGKSLVSSMFLYKIVYVCNGTNQVKTGNVSILR